MPGVASIKWSESNMAKALHALIGYGCVKVDEDEAAKVAAYLGGGCTNAAIKSLIATRKASFKPGPVPEVEKEEVPKVAKKRKAKAVAAKPAKTRKVTKKGKKAVQDSDDGDDENGYDEEKAGIVTPPSSGPKGESPRKATTVKSEHEHDEYDGLLDDAQSAKDSSSVENDTADGEFDPFAE